jgi:hypothetical protein
VLVTASGSPGGGRLVKSLQDNGERELRVVGTDMSARRGGRAICDSFHVVPPGSSDEFPGRLAELARREEVDVVPALVVRGVGRLAGGRPLRRAGPRRLARGHRRL